MRYSDRHDAGRRLAAMLGELRGECPVVVGVARGGVPVAAEIAAALEAPLDVAVVRKLGAPNNPEFAIGALAEGGVRLIDTRAVALLGLSEQRLEALLAPVREQLARQLARYRSDRAPLDLNARTAILVDDGLATGRSAIAAAESLRRRGAHRVVLAVPVAASQSLRRARRAFDAVVCPRVQVDLWAVGYWYEDFSSTDEEEVAAALRRWGDGAGAGLVRTPRTFCQQLNR